MKTNNIWNRFFHSKQVKENQVKANQCQKIISLYPEYELDIKNANSLQELFLLHKVIWDQGFQNENIGPCAWGYFRTKNISEMSPEEVYLGGIWGMVTRNIPFWEARKEDKYGCNDFGLPEDTKIYSLILKQYRNHMLLNLGAIYRIAAQDLLEYQYNGYETISQKS